LGTPRRAIYWITPNQNQDKTTQIGLWWPMMAYTLRFCCGFHCLKTSNLYFGGDQRRKTALHPRQNKPVFRCGSAEQAWPASLLPQQLLWFQQKAKSTKKPAHNLFRWHRSGACSYVWPKQYPWCNITATLKAAFAKPVNPT